VAQGEGPEFKPQYRKKKKKKIVLLWNWLGSRKEVSKSLYLALECRVHNIVTHTHKKDISNRDKVY
jgi:hypothetical protein